MKLEHYQLEKWVLVLWVHLSPDIESKMSILMAT